MPHQQILSSYYSKIVYIPRPMCGLKSSIEPDIFPYSTTKAHSESQSVFVGQISFFAVVFPWRQRTTTPIYLISPGRFLLRSCHRNPPAPCPHLWWSRRRFQWSMLSWSSLPGAAASCRQGQPCPDLSESTIGEPWSLGVPSWKETNL